MERFLIGDSSEILVGRGFPVPLLTHSDARSRVAVLVQPGADEVGQRVVAALDEEVMVVPLPDGEAAKSLAAVEAIYSRLAEIELGRGDTIVAVGGGAATDSAGFVAATWLRGIESVYVPTTLLGAVDAAIGGKTAVNVAGKNLVGVFWHPRRVIIDLDVLDGLDDDLKREGAAEVIKAGLLARPAILDAYLEDGLSAPLERLVPAAVEVKTAFVDEDFTEQGSRALLNLGHTVGHAVEFASGLSHGSSVAIGLVASAAVSERRLGFEETPVVRQVLESVGLPTAAPAVDRERVLDLLRLDKKRDRSGVRMILLASIGRPQIHHVDSDDISHALSAIGL